MGKKRDIANKNIETLIDELVAYEESYVTNSNCPYAYNLFGADGIEKPRSCEDCVTCKENFYLQVNNNLRERFIVD